MVSQEKYENQNQREGQIELPKLSTFREIDTC